MHLGVYCPLSPTTEQMKDKAAAPKGGTLVASGRHLFRVIDGVRYWVSEPPASYLQENMETNQGARDV